MSYKASRLAADLLLSQQKGIIEKYSSRLDFNRAKIENCFKVDDAADRNENTDLFFFEFRRLRIACRMRFNISSYAYNDITIRSSLGSGNPTELDKINSGYGDYMLYCWGTQDTIKEFVIIDLNEFRDHQDEFLKNSCIHNYDNYTAFTTYDLRKIIKTPCCVVANLNDEVAQGA